jgi:hypothetical protein
MEINEAIEIANQTSGAILDQAEWQTFAESVETAIDAAIENVAENYPKSPEDGLRQTFRELASQFFVAGIIWRDAQLPADESADPGADFTVVMDTVPFLAALVNNQSLTVRFALTQEGEQP